MPRKRTDRMATSDIEEKQKKPVSFSSQGRITRSMRMQTGMLNSGMYEHFFEKIWKSLPKEKQSAFVALDAIWFHTYEMGPKDCVLRWIKRKHIFEKKYILVPVVLWSHWSLLILCGFNEAHDSLEKCMILLDSLHSSNQTSLEAIARKFVMDIHESDGRTTFLDPLRHMPFMIPNVPQQEGSEECGYYALYFAYLFMQNTPEHFSLSEGYPYFMRPDWFKVDELLDFRRWLSETEKGIDDQDGISHESAPKSGDMALIEDDGGHTSEPEILRQQHECTSEQLDKLHIIEKEDAICKTEGDLKPGLAKMKTTDVSLSKSSTQTKSFFTTPEKPMQAIDETAPSSHLETSGPAPSSGPASSSASRRGRGHAKFPSKWGTGNRLNVRLTPEGQITGEEYNDFATSCGVLAKMGSKLPITYTDWHDVPQDTKDNLWQEVLDNTTLPNSNAAKKVVLGMINSSWRDHKSKLKKEWFIAHKSSAEIPFCGDKRVEPDQWKQICQYWRKDNVQKAAEQNSINRACQQFPPLTGRKPFSRVREEMSSEGKSTTQYDVFLETRKRKGACVDEVTSQVVDQMEKELTALPQEQQTPEAKLNIFTKAMGCDKRGRMRCVGRGPSKTSMREYAAMNISSQVEQVRVEMEERMEQKIEMRLQRQQEEMMAQFQAEKEEIRADFQRQLDAFLSRLDPNVVANFVVSPRPPSTASNTSPGVESSKNNAICAPANIPSPDCTTPSPK